MIGCTLFVLGTYTYAAVGTAVDLYRRVVPRQPAVLREYAVAFIEGMRL